MDVRKYLVYGEELTVSEMSKKYGVSTNTIYVRLLKGWPPEEAVNNERGFILKQHKYEYTGKRGYFKGTISEISKHFNINYKTLHSRLKRYGNINEAIDMPNKIIYHYNGKLGDIKGTVNFISNKLDLEPNSIRQKLEKGMDINQAVELTFKFKIKIIEFNGFKGNVKQVAEHFGINYGAFYSRLYRGYTVEDAILTPLKIVRTKNLSYKGFSGNLKEICDHFGKNYDEVYENFIHMHTLEWSMDHASNVE